MIEILECKGDAVLVEMKRLVEADNIDIELVEYAKGTRSCSDIHDSVCRQYDFFKFIQKMNKPYERIVIGLK